MGDIQILIEMGFDKERVEYAMKITNNIGVEPAMEWLLAHAEEELPRPDNTLVLDGGDGNKPEANDAMNTCNNGPTVENKVPAIEGKTAKSLKCDDCGKLLRDQLEVQYHATKTGHVSFSESSEEKKPLTEEEKKQQLALIEEKMKKKRLEREEREKQDALERERNRIKSGKDMTEARKRLEELEMKKLVEQRKREKAEERAARERVRAQIEADKARRKAGQEQNNPTATAATLLANNSVGSTSITASLSSTSAAAAVTVATATTAAVKSAAKDYTQTRIQVRLRDGSTLTETFNVKEQLSAVRVFIQMKLSNEMPFGLMTTFPRKVFDSDDYEKPLDVLGLVPSAVLIVTKPPTA